MTAYLLSILSLFGLIALTACLIARRAEEDARELKHLNELMTPKVLLWDEFVENAGSSAEATRISIAARAERELRERLPDDIVDRMIRHAMQDMRRADWKGRESLRVVRGEGA